MNISKKIYSVECNKYIKFINGKISYIFDKTIICSIICSKFRRIFQEKESIEILKFLGLINDMNT